MYECYICHYKNENQKEFWQEKGNNYTCKVDNLCHERENVYIKEKQIKIKKRKEKNKIKNRQKIKSKYVYLKYYHYLNHGDYTTENFTLYFSKPGLEHCEYYKKFEFSRSIKKEYKFKIIFKYYSFNNYKIKLLCIDLNEISKNNLIINDDNISYNKSDNDNDDNDDDDDDEIYKSDSDKSDLDDCESLHTGSGTDTDTECDSINQQPINFNEQTRVFDWELIND